MKRFLPFIIVITVGLLAVGGGAYLYRAKRPAGPKLSKIESGPASGPVHVLGPENAAVTIEEFGDFQCPPCGRLSEPINQLQRQYNIRVIYRNFPLPNHRWAKDAAAAAEAA